MSSRMEIAAMVGGRQALQLMLQPYSVLELGLPYSRLAGAQPRMTW